MSTDEPQNVPATRDKRTAVREKAQQVNARLRRRIWIRRGIIAAIVLVLVAAAIVAVSIAIGSDRERPQQSLPASSGDGITVTALRGEPVSEPVIPEGTPSAPVPTATPNPSPTSEAMVDIRIYLDYLSESAAMFQSTNSELLKEWLTTGAATITYHPVATLNAKSNGTKYSQRAAAAAACVGTLSPDWFYAFNNNLLSKQPKPETDGYSDKEIAALAIASGVDAPERVRECIEDGSYLTWAREATERAQESLPDTDDLALVDVPTVLVNGQQYVGNLDDPAELNAFVLAVSSDSFYEDTATPSPTPTP